MWGRYENSAHRGVRRSRATFYRLGMETDRSEGGSRLAKVRVFPSFLAKVGENSYGDPSGDRIYKSATSGEGVYEHR